NGGDDDGHGDSDRAGRARNTGPLPFVPPPSAGARDFAELRRTLSELVHGIGALHEAGYLHCDIKPSNILVDRSGRVVLLDFGLITAARAEHWPDEQVVGTPAYMAPEQVLGEDLDGSCDWFGVGVVLYQMLTGRWPRPWSWYQDFRDGRPLPDIPASRAHRAEIPDDLDELCTALLAADRRARPGGPDILRRLAAQAVPNPLAGRRSGPIAVPVSAGQTGSLAVRLPLIGRAPQLAALAAALDAVADDHGRVIYVRGAPGMGKTTLVHHFLDRQVRPDAGGADAGPVILRGRCYQREHVPFRALDSVIDALCQYLVALATAERAALSPDDMPAQMRLFPVLQRADDHLSAPRDGRDPAAAGPGDTMADSPGDTVADGPADGGALARDADNARRLRMRAAEALRQLLTAIAAAHRLVLFIDDLQWGDADSAVLLEALMRPPAPRRLLLILAYRDQDVGSSPLLSALLLKGHGFGMDAPTRTIDVGALGRTEAIRLADMLLTRAAGPDALERGADQRAASDPRSA
ncbi:MAG: AAA family ATPase, partial [Myxococcota bacterium]